jgi:hypothetical protein
MKKTIAIGISAIPIFFAFFVSCENPSPADPELLAPKSVKAELMGEEFHVTWEKQETGCAYEVSRKTGEGEYRPVSASPVNDAFFVDTDFPEDCSLQYTVKSVRGGHCSPTSPPSNTVSRYILNLKASRLEYTDRIDVSWSAYEGANGYVVYRHDPACSIPSIIGQPEGCEFVDTTGDMNTAYFYQVSWMEKNTEKGTGGPKALGLYSDQKDFYEPNDDFEEIEPQSGTSVFNPGQPPLMYSFGDPGGNIYADTDWYKYYGPALPVKVTITLPEASLFENGELEFSFFYNNTSTPSLDIYRGTSQFLFDNFGSVQGDVGVYFKIFPSVASTRQVMGTYTVEIRTGL